MLAIQTHIPKYSHTLLYHVLQIFHFLQIEGLWKTKIEEVGSFSNSFCSIYVSVPHLIISQYFKCSSYYMVICNK